LHLKMDGANGSTTFTDSSPNAIVVTAAGNAQISTTQSKYGGASAYFDGSTAYLTQSSNLTQFGTADFTVEFWMRYSSATGYRHVIGSALTAAGLAFGTNNYSGSVKMYATTLTIGYAGSSVLSADTWYHMSFVRQSGVIKFYLNGNLDGTHAVATNFTETGGAVGANTSGAYKFNGFIDELKITKGVARYTSAFTSPPIPSTCTDLTKNKNVGTLTNGVDYNFSNGGSLVFNGTSSYITLGTNSNLNFGTGDFTIDCWYKLSATTPNDQGILNDTAGTFSSGSVLFKARQNSSGGKVSLQAYDFSSVGGRILTSSTTIAANIWYNAIVTRIGNSFTLYINGRSESTGTFAGNMNFNNNSGTYIGYSILDAANGYLKGNIPMIKIYKGKGLTSGEVYNNFVANRGRFGV
jgi:hypothetical protein